MRTIYALVLLLLVCNYKLLSQSKDMRCNRGTDIPSYTKHIIKEVCIPKGHVITMLYTDLIDIDLDGDSIGDFIFNHRKPKLSEMDTTYISVYKKINDSTYVFLKTFNNLYPVYMKSYDYPSKNPFVAKIFNCYGRTYPLNHMEMENGVISLTISIDPASGYFLRYTYKPEKKNWYLTTYQKWIDMPDGIRDSQDRPIPEEGESIDQFSYQKYLCPEESFNK